MIRGLLLRLCLLSALLTGLWWGTVAPLRAVRSGHIEVAAFDDTLVLALAAFGWVAVAWIALVVVVIALSRSGGPLGRWGGRAARRIAPAAVRRGVIAAMGLSVSVLATAPMSSAMSPDAAVPSSAAQANDPTGAPGSLPVIGRPVAAKPQPSTPDRQPDVRTKIAVQPGDSLWTIAERALGDGATPQTIADSWPRWFAANRDEIGPDPDQIRPGMRLVAPSMPTTD